MRNTRHLLYSSVLASLSLLGTAQAYGQSYLVSEGFEGQVFPPKGWSQIDKDGDGHCWQIATKGQATLNGNQTAISYTVNPENVSPYGAQDNWLVTPQIDVTNNTFKLAFKCCAQDEDTPEKLQVLVSTTGTAPEDFTDVIYDETLENGYDGVELQSVSRSLANYAGQKIYIAFRHTGQNTYAVGVDDVIITNEKGPKAVSGLTVKAGSEGRLSATLEWTNPATNGAGENLTALAVGIYRDYQLVATLADGMKPGEKAVYEDSGMTVGTHVYSIAVRTTEGESRAVSKSVYVGEDVPAAVTAITVKKARGKNIVSWTAPAAGANKGYLNPANITYDVKRNTPTDTVLVATGLTALSLTDTPPDGVLTSYTVIPVNAAGKGVALQSGATVAYGAPLKDFDATPGATCEYANPKLPFDVSTKAVVSEFVYLPEELRYAHGTVEAVVLRNSFKNHSLIKPVRIWLGETDKVDLSGGWIKADDLKLVYEGNLQMPEGDNDLPIPLDTPYDYQGGNLVMLAEMKGTQGQGSYFDRFYVQQMADGSKRSLTATSYDNDFDVAQATATAGDVCAALPATRFVLKAQGVAGVSGTVTDRATGSPVAGATVTVTDLGYTALTDADGTYSFDAVKSGDHPLTVSARGYNTLTTTLIVGAEGNQTNNLQLEAKQSVAVQGKVLLDDMTQSVAGITVTAQGYSDTETVTAQDGTFALTLYAGEDYQLTCSYPLYDDSLVTVNATAARTLADIRLRRSPIAPFGVQAQPSGDGRSTVITWQAPDARTGKTRWTRWNTSGTTDGYSGDYSVNDFYVAHAFTAQDTQDSCMVGQSFTQLRANLKGSKSVFTAMIWAGDKNSHTLLASKEVKGVTDEGGWVTVDFSDTPVEIRQGVDYLVGIHCQMADNNSVGHGPSGSKVTGKNCLKWSDSEYLYDGYYGWNISALCGIPGSRGLYGKPEAAVPACTYQVYRASATQADSSAVLVKEGLKATELTVTDNTWEHAESGKYLYLVKAVYGDRASVEAQSDTIARLVNTDAGIDSILSPVKSKDMQGEVDVKVRIRNYGEHPLTSVPVRVKIGDEELTATYEGNIAKGGTADVAVGSVTLRPSTYYTLTACTRLEGDETAGNDSMTVSLPNYPDVHLRAFRWDAYGDAGLMSIHTNIPEQATFVKEITPGESLLNAGEYYGGRYYGYTSTWYSDPRAFVVLDTITWTPVKSVSTTDYVLDMAYDYKTATMYGLAIKNNQNTLVTIDLATGATTSVAPVTTSLFTLACSLDGQLYGVSDKGDLCTVDKATAETAVVGATGETDVRYVQSMAFDHQSGRLFWAQTGAGTSGVLYEIDPHTGKAMKMGTTLFAGYPSELVGLYVPYTDVAATIAARPSGMASDVCAFVNAAGHVDMTVPLAEGETARVSVVSLSGAVVAKTTVSESHTVIPVALQPGVYIIHVTTSTGTTANVKVRR